MFGLLLRAAATVVVLVSPSLKASIIQVPAQVATIQGAINFAKNGDTVLVAPGTYYENINFRGKKITVASRYIFENAGHFIKETIIDGSQPVHPDTASVVVFGSGEDSRAKLIGFTITNGIGTLVPSSFVGGGIFVTGNSSPTIMFNIVRQNSAIIGGGIAVRYATPKITNNAIVANTAGTGGGLSLENAEAMVTHNVFYGNVADGNGGAVSVKVGLADFLNNCVANNRARLGGGLSCELGIWTIEFNDFYLNQGGDFNLCGDTALGHFGATVNYNLDSVDRYSNMSVPPLFVNTTTYDFSLQCTSRLIDAGALKPASYPIGGAREDIGMFEYPYRVADLNSDGHVNVVDATAMINIIFFDAPLPCPLYAFDADCDRKTTIADAVALINYWMGISETDCLFTPKPN